MNLKTAIDIAFAAHAGQTDKGGNPYIWHCLRVMAAGKTEDEMVVGVLHDVLEDTGFKLEDLVSGVQARALDAITRKSGESYDDFIFRVAHNRLASRVKVADLKDNSDLSRLPKIGPRDLTRTLKYGRALKLLLENLG